MKSKFYFLIALILFVAPHGKAQTTTPSTLDNSFGIGAGFNSTVQAMVIQPDGKILVGGDFTSYNNQPRNYLVRLNTDGTLDNSFDIGTGFNSSVFDIALQPDGKILVGGYFTSFNGKTRNRMVRLVADGALDDSFNIGTAFNNAVETIVLQTDGKILIGGYFTSYNGQNRNRIIRLDPDGAVDASFNIGTGFNNAVTRIALQLDGKILAGGFFITYNGQSRQRIVRMNMDGSVDDSFNIGTGFDNGVQTIVIQPDGKILVGGDFTRYKGSVSNRIIRLEKNGATENGFGSGFDSAVNTIALQPDGKILVGGYFSSYRGQNQYGIVRLERAGAFDRFFHINQGPNAHVRTIVQDPEGKILVGGAFTSYLGASRNRMARLNGVRACTIVGDVRLSSKAQMYTFYTEHAACTTITGNVNISGDLTSLNELGNVISIGGTLSIYSQSLQNLTGLNALRSIAGNLEFTYAPALQNLGGLSSLQSIGGNLSVSSTPALQNLEGLSTLQSIGGSLNIRNTVLQNFKGLSALQSIGGSLDVRSNQGLTGLNGLNSLKSIGNHLLIAGNGVMTDVNGIMSLKSIGGGLDISNNPRLGYLYGLGGLQSIGGYLNIQNNGSLTDITGLRNVNPSFGSTGLTIKNNTQLSVCYLPNLCNYLSQPAASHPRAISGNMSNCLDEAAMLSNCCPSGDFVFGSQQDVDDFRAAYASCGNITLRHVTITGYDITNLDGLANIQNIEGTLTIYGNSVLKNLDGLRNVTSIGEELVMHVSNMENVDGLSNLKSIGGNLRILRNPDLTNLDGLSSLETVGGNLAIEANSALANLNGLSRLQSIGGQLFVATHPVLTDISGLRNIDPATIGGRFGLFIGYNPNLPVCNLPNICTYLRGSGPREIQGNKDDCVSEQAAKLSCGTCTAGNLEAVSGDAGTTKILTSGNNYLYDECTLLAMVAPSGDTGGKTITVNATTADQLITHGRATYLRSYFDISVDQPTGARVTLFFSKADFDHYNDTFGNANGAKLPENLRVARYHGAYSVSGAALSSATTPDFRNQPSVTWNRTLELWEVTFDTPGFSGFFITGQSEDALPVRWISFQGNVNEQHRATLTWKADETNVSHYEVERSANARNFHVTGTVDARGTGLADYIFTDPIPVSGTIYYRLRQVDQAADGRAGKFSYSRIISLASGRQNELFAYPNPTRDRIAVEVGLGYTGSKVRLISPTGIILQEAEVKGDVLTFDISRYTSGIYLIQLSDGKTIKVIVP